MKNDEIEKAITAVGAIIEISWFLYNQMIKEGYTEEQSFQTAKEFILQSLNLPQRENINL